MLLDRIKRASVLPNPIGEESNLDRLPSMVRTYLENAQAMINRVPYHLRWLVVSVEDSPPGRGGAQLALGAIHNKQILYVDDQAAHYNGPIQGQRPYG